MKAIVQKRYGSPNDLELADVEAPGPADDEVLVRVRSASLHPDVWHVVSGRPHVLRLMGAGLRRPKNPIPGTDMAGIVESVGAQARRFRPGDEVFGETLASHLWTHGGAYAELVSVREEWLAPKPANVSFQEAASVPTAGFIALVNFRHASRLRAGQRALINGGAGGVGSIALQLAKARGAHVTGVDGPTKLDLMRRLGADEVLDYTTEDFARRGERYHLVFDIPGSRPWTEVRRALEPDGQYIPIGHDHFGAEGRRVFGLLPHFLRLAVVGRFAKALRGQGVPAPTRGEAMATLAGLLEAGTITPIIDRSYPLAEFSEAFHHMIEGRPRGRVVLTM